MVQRKMEFKYNIGDRIVDNNRDLTIIERKIVTDEKGHRFKYYKFHCNKCRFDCDEHYNIKQEKYNEEYWVLERHFKEGIGCACCANQIVVEHINSLVITTPWMIQYFQGGYEEAKKYISGSNKYIYPICPNCHKIKDKPMRINTIYQYSSIGCPCSDTIPYGEKLIFSVLEQLGLDFKTQLSKATYNWCKDYKYDFHFLSKGEDILIEVNGNQHYTDAWDKLEKTQLNDKIKKELALSNGIKEENYIVIDCRKSELEFIKNSTLNDIKITNKFDLSNINWIKAEEFALSNRVKEACDLWNSGIHSTKEIANIMKIHFSTITRYLKQGSLFELNWCDYNPENELIKAGKEHGGNGSKSINVYKDDVFLGNFPSGHELERQSEELFGTKLDYRNISAVCNEKRKKYKGYIFKFVENDLKEVANF